MSINSRKSLVWTVLLVAMGIVALFAGARSLILLIPAATLVWYEARTMIRGGRN